VRTVSNDVTIGVEVDTLAAEQSLDEVQKRADEITKNWAVQRNTILRQVREGFTMISSLMSSARQAFALFGAQIDPFFSALVSTVLATASMLISAATTLALTGIGGVAAAVVFAIAISFQILTLGKLIDDKTQILSGFAKMLANLQSSTATMPTIQGAPF